MSKMSKVPGKNVVIRVKRFMQQFEGEHSLEDICNGTDSSPYEVRFALSYIMDSEFPHYEEVTGRHKLCERKWRFKLPEQVVAANHRAAEASRLLHQIQAFLNTVPAHDLLDSDDEPALLK